MKRYISPQTDIISPTYGILESIDIHNSLGLDEDAANSHPFEEDTDPDEFDAFFDSEF